MFDVLPIGTTGNLVSGDQNIFTIPPETRLKHTAIFGATGAGKSTLLGNVVAWDLANGAGLSLVDPHGGLYEHILSNHIPRRRKNDVILFNPRDTTHVLALDLRARLLSLYSGERRPAQKPADPEVISRLRSLGYLGGGPSKSGSGADPKDRLREYERYGRAMQFANTEHLPEAISEFKKLLEEDGQNVLVHFYLAVCYYRSRRLDEAVKALDATLMTASDYPPAEELLGTIWLLKKDYVRARRQFAHLAAIAPENYGAHYNLGILAMREGRMEKAERELQAAARADSGSAQAHAALGSLYRAQGDLNRARDEFRQALAIDPHDETSRKALGSIAGTRP